MVSSCALDQAMPRRVGYVEVSTVVWPSLLEAREAGIRVSSEEQSYLEWFIHGTAAKPPRIFNSAFWDPAILQATIHEPMVLNGLLALSAAHKRHVLDPASRARDGLVPDALEVFLLKNYGSAIKGLQGVLSGHERVPRSKRFAVTTMCICSLLTELMRGRFDVGRMHLSNGAHIVKESINEPGRTDLSPVLVQFFPKIQDQMMLFQRQSPAQQLILTPSATSPVPKLRFTSPAEAGCYLEDLIEQAAYLAEQKKTDTMSCDSIPRNAQ